MIRRVFDFSIEDFAKEDRPFEKAKNITQYLYYFLAFQSVNILFSAGSFLAQKESFTPLWPLFWVHLLEYPNIVYTILLLFFFSAIIGALFYRHRLARILVFLGVFQLHAFLSSFGRTDHQWYPMLYVFFLLMFLPSIWTAHKKFLLVFFAAQSSVLFIYSMGGIGKVLGAIGQIQAGEANLFIPEALALHTASEFVAHSTTSFLGSFIIQHPWIGWPFFLAGIYLQLFALWVAFKPSLHRIWAVGLLLFHAGTYLIMNVPFGGTVILLIFLFFDSPFRKENGQLREAMFDLPVFGLILRWATKQWVSK